MKTILLVGTFPPPVHGMAAVNQALLERLQSEGWAVEKLDTAPQTLKRDLLSRFSRWGKMSRAWLRLLHARKRNELLYLALAGGWGQVYDLLTVILGRLKRLRLVLHHHSFAYLQKKSLLTTLLLWLAGENALHIVLCKAMGLLLQEQYGRRYSTRMLSNLALFSADSKPRSAPRLQKVGFLGNITREKGGETLIRLARAIREKGLPLEVCLAGPCPDPQLQGQLLAACDEKILEWRGAVHGMEKSNFWQELDVFIFPTRYENEAEPLVVWEALAVSLPIITFRRGCIADQLGNTAILLNPETDFVSAALEILENWLREEGEYQVAVEQACLRYQAVMEQTRLQWRAFLDVLSF